MIVAGLSKDLIETVYSRLDSSQIASGLMFALVWLESSGTNGGKYYSTSGWVDQSTLLSSSGLWLQGTHVKSGMWRYTLAGIVTSGLSGSIVHFTFTNNMTEGFATSVAAAGEHRIYTDDIPVRIYEMEPG